MVKYIVSGIMVKTFNFKSLAKAKQNLRNQLKNKHIMGLSAWITQHNKNGTGIHYQYFTRTGDRTYKLVLLKKTKILFYYKEKITMAKAKISKLDAYKIVKRYGIKFNGFR